MIVGGPGGDILQLAALLIENVINADDRPAGAVVPGSRPGPCPSQSTWPEGPISFSRASLTRMEPEAMQPAGEDEDPLVTGRLPAL